MKLITLSIELVIDDRVCEMIDGIYNKDCIASYLNSKLYVDPEFFGDFGPENIIGVKEINE
jgi:hypothetical protein